LDELGPWVGGVGKLGESIANLPMGRLIVPVVRTPTNIAHFTLERTPLLQMASKTFRNDLMAGGARRAQALGKFGGSATLVASFIYFAGSEIVTGGGPVDDGLRRNKTELTGWQPYSIKVGDTYYAYDRLTPLGAMLGAIADYTELRSGMEDWQAEELTQSIILTVQRNLTSKVFLESVADLFDGVAGDDAALKRALHSGARIALVPGLCAP
jgi:hypothetical protein